MWPAKQLVGCKTHEARMQSSLHRLRRDASTLVCHQSAVMSICWHSVGLAGESCSTVAVQLWSFPAPSALSACSLCQIALAMPRCGRTSSHERVLTSCEPPPVVSILALLSLSRGHHAPNNSISLPLAISGLSAPLPLPKSVQLSQSRPLSICCTAGCPFVLVTLIAFPLRL